MAGRGRLLGGALDTRLRVGFWVIEGRGFDYLD